MIRYKTGLLNLLLIKLLNSKFCFRGFWNENFFRSSLESELGQKLDDFKAFIDEEILLILGNRIGTKKNKKNSF